MGGAMSVGEDGFDRSPSAGQKRLMLQPIPRRIAQGHMLARSIEEVFRREGGRVLAGLIRRFGDFSLAEDLLQDACRKALERWPREGLPDNPAAWLTTAARNAGLDHVRRAAKTLADSTEVLAALEQQANPEPDEGEAI